MNKALKILTTWGVPVAYLNPPADALHNVRVELNLNGPWILSGVLPYNSEKWDYFTDAYVFEIDGRHFRLVSTEEQRDDKGRLLANFKAEGMWAIELGTLYGPTRSVEVLSATAPQAMTAVLAGTGWSVGTVTVPDSEIHDLETEKDSVIQNLQRIRELWGGDLVFDTANRTVSLYAEGDYGADNGMQFRYRKNNRQIKRSIKWLPINRLYVYGKDDLTIASVNGGLEYLEDFTYTRQALGLGPTDPIPQAAIREGKITNQDIDDPAELLDWGQKQFPDLLQPKAAYTVSVADLRTLTGHEHETFDMGDWATAIDEGLDVNFKARIVRYVYDPFGGYYPGVPPMAEVTLANFEDNIQQLLADLARTAQTVKESILRNRILRRIALDGLINTAAVEILSGNTELSWGADGITAREVDGQGQPTGRLLRLTGQGLAISEDGGQNWGLALTPNGLLGSWVIVSDVYAITTADGYTRLSGTGLECWDNQAVPVMRAKFGQYEAGKFGLKLRDRTGNVVILDEDGILQTWQEGRADNIDATHPLMLSIYLPPETKSIHKALLRFRLQAFRAYETGAASGGGSTSGPYSQSGLPTSTKASESIQTHTTGSSALWYLYSLNIIDAVSYAGQHNHDGNTGSYGGHSHLYTYQMANGTWVDAYTDWEPDHWHSISTVYNHTHNLTADHKHDLTIPGHTHTFDMPSHTHTTPNHSHEMVYGIYTSTPATNVAVKINGLDRTLNLGGPFSTDQANLNIAPYLVVGQWNTVELDSVQLGRIDATVFIQAKMGV